MTEKIVAEPEPCPSKTGLGIQKTGEKSAAPSSTGPAIAAKAAPPIPTVAPATTNPIPSPAAESCSPSPISTTSPKTATPPTSAPGASDATLPMTGNTMLNPDERIEASSGTTDNPNSSTGENKKPKRLTQRQLMARLKSDSEREGDLLLCQLTAEAYRPCHDAINKFKFVHGTSSPNLHMTFNLSMAAKARMNGKNDPNATPRQRYAYMGMCLDIAEVYSQGLDEGWPRDEIKRVGNERMTRTALFNGLGTQKDRKQAKRTQK